MVMIQKKVVFEYNALSSGNLLSLCLLVDFCGVRIELSNVNTVVLTHYLLK